MKYRILIWVGGPLLVGVLSILLVAPVDLRALLLGWAEKKALIECPELLELGDRELGEVAIARFTITNQGSGELFVDNVRTNCSCSGVEREDGREFIRVNELRLAPGHRADLAVRIAVRGTPGSQARNAILLRTNDPRRPEVRIDTMIRRITGGLITFPRSVVFGTVLEGATPIQMVDLYDQSAQPRTIEQVASSNPEQFSVRLVSPTPPPEFGQQVEAGVLIGRIEVSLKSVGPGAIHGEIRTQLAGEGAVLESIPVVGNIVPAIQVTPALLVLPRASNSGAVYSGTCLCHSSQGKPLSLSVASLSAGLTAKISAVDDNPSTKIVRITWDPKPSIQRGASLRRVVRLKAHIEGREIVVEIPVLCRPEGNT